VGGDRSSGLTGGNSPLGGLLGGSRNGGGLLGRRSHRYGQYDEDVSLTFPTLFPRELADILERSLQRAGQCYRIRQASS
jgi:hypothetical protein